MPGPCRTPGCDSPTTSRYSVYCSRHQSRLRRQGDVTQEAISKAELKTYLKRVRQRIAKNPDSPAWGPSLRPTGRLRLNVIGSVAQFEREVMLERQREGIAKARADGRYKGHAPTARNQSEVIVALSKAGMMRLKIAETLGMSERSVYRVLGAR